MEITTIAVAIPTCRREALLRRLIASVASALQVFNTDDASNFPPWATPLRAMIPHSLTRAVIVANGIQAFSLVAGIYPPMRQGCYLAGRELRT